MNKILLLDCNYLCRRAQHTTGELTNGVLFGFFRDLIVLREHFPEYSPVFCFDRGPFRRSSIYPDYKANRKRSNGDEAKESQFQIELKELRRVHLKEMGFQNIFRKEGFEADDLIARIVQDKEFENAIIVSADHDLYQCLQKGVRIWHPQQKKLLSHKWFKETYKVFASDWPFIKAVAGCSSDNIKGIQGVGEATACKFVLGELKKSSKAYQAIIVGQDHIHNNCQLTRLPFPGTPKCKLKDSPDFIPERWNATLKRIGMLSLVGTLPGARRNRAGSM